MLKNARLANSVLILVSIYFATLSPAESLGPRLFTADIMLRNEDVGEVLFQPDGKRILIEKLAPYERKQNFPLRVIEYTKRASLMTIDLEKSSNERRPPKDVLEGWIGSHSPEGAQVAIRWLDGDHVKLGVYDFATERVRKFDLLIGETGACNLNCPVWQSEGRLIELVPSADKQSEQANPTIYDTRRISRWNEAAWAGEGPTVEVYGSGRYPRNAAGRASTLAEVDVRTGRVTSLAEGEFAEMNLSPDRKRLAVLRDAGEEVLQATEVSASQGANRVHELDVYEFGDKTVSFIPCDECNVLQSTLRWTPSGGKLFFSVRTIAGGKLGSESYIYDFKRRSLSRFSPQGLNFVINDAHYNAVPPFTWLDEETPVIRTATAVEPNGATKGGRAQHVRYDWYSLPPHKAPVKLTLRLGPNADAQLPDDFQGVRKNRIYFVHAGRLWSVSQNGRQMNLTASIPELLSPWCPAFAEWRGEASPVCSGLRTRRVVREPEDRTWAQGWITFRVLDSGKNAVPTGDVVFFNVDTREVIRIRKPDSSAEVFAASPERQLALYRTQGSDGDHLVVVGVNGAQKDVIRYNAHLAGVESARSTMLFRAEGGDPQANIDWLMLPPGYTPGRRYPLLVYFYPGTVNSRDHQDAGIRETSFLNLQLAAARGYAVLKPTVRFYATKEHGDPMLEMHAQLIQAAENAVRAGYADPARWAVMGHSYGGYGTTSVITQTNRFKAAIALDGAANLTSMYAIGTPPGDSSPVSPLYLWGVRWLEDGQARMGVPPWIDSSRYIRNSPLFSADKIETPLLLIQGNSDSIAGNESEQMFNALRRQGKDAVFLRYWGEGHIYASPANIRDMWQRIPAWLDDYLNVAP